jgi:UDP-4-amino-4,6-dideoxy-N-acetyl-beta-L-altrosamine transaminase
VKPIPYGRQEITQADIAAVTETLRGDYLTQGPKVLEFERAFAGYIGAKYTVAVSNGTAALHLCALALNVAPGQRVITSPITFAASANCIRYCGGEVDFCDIDPVTYCLDIGLVRAKLEAAPKGTYHGIIPVDFAGYPCDLKAWRALADEFRLWLIEDACHAPGAEIPGSHRAGDGTFADLAIFSFHPVKHIATGEGGMITTNRKDLYDRLLMLRTHGITKDPERMQEQPGGWWYEMQELGYNYRMPDVLCALGSSQLARAEANLARRRQIAARYDAALAGLSGVTLPKVADGIDHAYHLYVVQVPERKHVYDELKAKGIYTQVHYIPVTWLPYYEGLGWRRGQFPVAEAYYERCLSLPMFPSLTDAEQEYVITQVREAVGVQARIAHG